MDIFTQSHINYKQTLKNPFLFAMLHPNDYFSWTTSHRHRTNLRTRKTPLYVFFIQFAREGLVAGDGVAGMGVGVVVSEIDHPASPFQNLEIRGIGV